MTTTTVQLTIVDGPSKWDLSIALFNKSLARNGPRFVDAVRFKTAESQRHFVIVSSVQCEDGSRESWNIEGHELNENGSLGNRVFIYYRTDKRTGCLKFSS